jgi:hypothetical protein
MKKILENFKKSKDEIKERKSYERKSREKIKKKEIEYETVGKRVVSFNFWDRKIKALSGDQKKNKGYSSEKITTEMVLEVGDRVVFKKYDEKATIRYIGCIDESELKWIGLEWDSEGLGKNDGSLNQKSYFTCPPKAGIFIENSKFLDNFEKIKVIEGILSNNSSFSKKDSQKEDCSNKILENNLNNENENNLKNENENNLKTIENYQENKEITEKEIEKNTTNLETEKNNTNLETEKNNSETENKINTETKENLTNSYENTENNKISFENMNKLKIIKNNLKNQNLINTINTLETEITIPENNTNSTYDEKEKLKDENNLEKILNLSKKISQSEEMIEDIASSDDEKETKGEKESGGKKVDKEEETMRNSFYNNIVARKNSIVEQKSDEVTIGTKKKEVLKEEPKKRKSLNLFKRLTIDFEKGRKSVNDQMLNKKRGNEKEKKEVVQESKPVVKEEKSEIKEIKIENEIKIIENVNETKETKTETVSDKPKESNEEKFNEKTGKRKSNKFTEIFFKNKIETEIKIDSTNSDSVNSPTDKKIFKYSKKKEDILSLNTNLEQKKYTLKVNKEEMIKDFHEHSIIGDIQILEKYLKKSKFDIINSIDKSDGTTPLHKSSMINNHVVVKFLCENGAKVDLLDNLNSTPLHWCCSKGFLESVQILAKHKADLNKKDYYGKAPLYLGIFFNSNLNKRYQRDISKFQIF